MSYSKIFAIADALNAVLEHVSHYESVDKTDQYAVWAEDGEGSSVSCDNKKKEQTITGTIDYYTLTEKDPNVDKIQESLNAFGISFYLNSVQTEDGLEPGYTHFEWVWEI